MFLPHSPGIYIAMILDNEKNIKSWMSNYELDEPTLSVHQYLEDLDKSAASLEEFKTDAGNTPAFKRIDSSASSSSASGVKKFNITNKLFLDIESLSKNMQVLLKNYEMLVIAQVSEIKQETAATGNMGFDKFGLQTGEDYFKCKVDKVEHIVNFTC